jgi:hypothetical protein
MACQALAPPIARIYASPANSRWLSVDWKDGYFTLEPTVGRGRADARQLKCDPLDFAIRRKQCCCMVLFPKEPRGEADQGGPFEGSRKTDHWFNYVH